jgi:myo-inositol 2-dehydrogenase/D-chiro-inositol 1-dehydrogenase
VTGVALVGVGRMGALHLRALPRARRVQLRVICDPAPSAAALGELAGVPVDADFEQTLGRGDVHFVVIAAPTPEHEALVAAALAAGKHVLCERPLTFDPDADMRLAADADRRNQGLHVGFWRRHAWPYREARRLIAEGEIGEPRMLRLAQWDAEPLSPAFCDPAVSGGIEIDCGVHELDLAAWLLGSPIAHVSAAGTHGDAAIEAVGDVEAVAALAVTAGGAPATIDLARSVRYGDDVRSEIVGAHGALLISAIGRGSLHVGDVSGLAASPSVIDLVLDDALAAQADCFARAIEGQRDPALPGASESAHALAAAQAMRRARLSGEVELVTLAS